MARRKTRQQSLWITLPLWMAVGGLVIWGLWQASEFRRTLIAEVRQNEAMTAQVLLEKEVTVEPIRENETELVANQTDRPTMDRQATAPTAADLLSEAKETTFIHMGMPESIDMAATIEVFDPLQEGFAAGPPEQHTGREAGFADATPFDAALSSSDLVASGTKLLDAGHVAEGRAALNAALLRMTDARQAEGLRQLLSQLNGSVFLGTALLADDPAVRYVAIEAGDTYLKLGREFGVPAAFLELINPSLNPRNLKPRTGIKVVRGPFSLRVIKREGRIDLFAREMYVRSFAMELPEGNFLPRGDYRIGPGAKVQVASRLWIGFAGTEEGNQAVDSGWIYGSAGPRGNLPRDRSSGIRVRDADLQQLYNVLVEARSHVRVEP